VAINHYGYGMFTELLGAGSSIGTLCHLRLGDTFAAAVATLGFTVFASISGALHAKSFQPAECLRET
jgi:ABC-type lipoprotein release transport system permease subunit